MRFVVFMAIWAAGCVFVDYVVPDIENAYQMAIGYFVGAAGFAVSGLIEK